jgi:transcriptional regulator with XRE-family HTH domain
MVLLFYGNEQEEKMLGDNIRKIRKNRHISVNKLAKMSGISLGYISDLENNKFTNPTVDKLNKIADVLEVDIKDLFTEDQVSRAVKSMVNIQDMLNELKTKENINDSIYNITAKFDNEKFTKEEQEEITNFINYVISKRK